MTDDELHRLWNDGASITTIAKHARTKPTTIHARVRRLRQKEGLERWPYHQNYPIKARDPDPPKRPKRGASTLPPLGSAPRG